MPARGAAHSLVAAALATVTLLAATGLIGTQRSSVRAAETAPVSELAAPLKRAAKPAELKDLRTRTTRTFATATGARVVELYGESVNYRDRTGSWQTIHNALVASTEPGVAVENEANRYEAQLPSELAQKPVRIEVGGHWAEFELVGATGAPEVKGSVARYAGALPAVDLVYTVTGDALKEDLLLNGGRADDSYRFRLTVGPGMRVTRTPDGKLDFIADDGRTVFSSPAAFAYDADGESGPVRTHLRRTADASYEVTLGIDPEWLAARDRAFPVTLDPTVDFRGGGTSSSPAITQNCELSSATPNTAKCPPGWFRVGRTSTSTHRVLMKFGVESVVPARAEVLDATLTLTTDGGPADIDLHRVTRGWTHSATWNRYDGTNAWTTPGGDFQSTRTTWSNDAGGSTGTFKWQLTELAQQWVDRSVANEGFLLKKTDESTLGSAVFLGMGTGCCGPPQLRIVYEPRMGARRQWSFEGQQLRDRSGIAVNVANGNLLVTERDLRIAGTGLDLAVTRYYNNLSSHLSESGRGWRLNYGGEVGLEKFNDPTRGESIALYGSTGFAALYQKKEGASGYVTPSGLDATLTKEADNSFTLKFEKGEGKLLFDSRGWLTEQRDRNGNKLAYTLDANGNLTKITDTRSRDITFGYTGGYISSMSDPSGRSWGYQVSNGSLTTYTDPAGKATRYAYDGANNLTEITDPRNNKTKFTYDAQRRVKTVTRVDNPAQGTGPTWTFDYEVSGTSCPADRNATKVTDPRGKVTTHCWDNTLRVTKVFDPEGHGRSKRYTSNSDIDLFTAGSGADTALTYDGSNRVSSITSPAETGNQPARRTFSYNAGNASFRPDSTTDAQGNTSSMTYTTKGNLRQLREVGSATAQVELEYNDGDSGETANDGTVRWSKDGNGNQTSYFYTAKGELQRVDYPDGTGAGNAALGDVTYTYDSLSRVQTLTDGKNQQQTFFYDPVDRIDKIEYRNSAGALVQTIDYSWDENGNLVGRSDGTGAATFVHDPLNRVVEERKPNRPTILYAYDAASNLASVTAGGEQITYMYLPDNTVDAVFEPDPTPGNGVDDRPKTEFRYNPDNSRTKTIYPNGVTEDVTFDKSERPKTIKATKTGNPTALTDFTYRWTGQGSTQERDLLQRAVDNRLTRTTDYTYDALNRLTLASTTGSQTFSYGYSYDNASNRMKLRRQGAVSRSYAYDNNNRLCWQAPVDSSAACGSPPTGSTRFRYDANGNFTGTSTGSDPLSYNALTYNEVNQTSSVFISGGAGGNMAYAGRGQSERVSYKSTSFTDTVLGTTIEQTSTTTRNYVRDEKRKFVVERVNTNGQITRRYPLFDQLGSTVALTDDQGNVVGRYVYEDPFGNNPVASGTASTALRFAGGYFDPDIALYKFGERYYMPSLGRWTQRDPLNQAFSPREANRYAYAGQDPINVVDPSGEDVFDDVGDFVSDNGRAVITGLHVTYIGITAASAGATCGVAMATFTPLGGAAACGAVVTAGYAADQYLESTGIWEGSYLLDE